jgi:uncharacterized membrane protein YhiD involved in acid resistance
MIEQVFGELARYESGPSWQMVLLCILLSFVLSQAVAAIYVWTYHGLSYSRSFVLALVMSGVVSTVLLLAIGNNVARGLGLLGTLAIIRFRSTMADTRDMVFVFATLSIGIAVGVQSFSVALVGTFVYCLIALHLALSAFGSRRQFDGLLRFQSRATPDADAECKRVIDVYCQNYVLVNLREVAQATRVEHAYQVKLRDASFGEALVAALRELDDVNGVALMMQDQAVEV